ncbi:unnamed protein product [Ectocarpus sp. 12 AP-2014]
MKALVMLSSLAPTAMRFPVYRNGEILPLVCVWFLDLLNSIDRMYGLGLPIRNAGRPVLSPYGAETRLLRVVIVRSSPPRLLVCWVLFVQRSKVVVVTINRSLGSSGLSLFDVVVFCLLVLAIQVVYILPLLTLSFLTILVCCFLVGTLD